MKEERVRSGGVGPWVLALRFTERGGVAKERPRRPVFVESGRGPSAPHTTRSALASSGRCVSNGSRKTPALRAFMPRRAAVSRTGYSTPPSL